MSEYVSTLTISDARLHYDIILKTAKRHRAARGASRLLTDYLGA